MNTCNQRGSFGLPRLFEEAVLEIGCKYALSDEHFEFLARFASLVAQVVFESSDDAELREMKSRESELASLDGGDVFEKALSELKTFMLESSVAATAR